MPRRTRSFLKALLMSLLLWTLAAVALDRVGQRPPPGGPYDAIVVAGCRVMPDGRPSPALGRRTRHAVELYRQGLAPRIVLTGGLGGFPPAEAVAAADLALSLGVPRAALLIEDQSHSTEENARFAAARLQEEGLPAQRILVVSDSYHGFRARRVFARYFPEVESTGSRPQAWVRVKGSYREVLAVGGYAAAGRISWRSRGIDRG